MTSFVDIFERYLSMRGYIYQRIDGSTLSTRKQQIVDEFNSKESQMFLLLLSTHAAALGLNLQEGDTVIIYDSAWDPQIDLQDGGMSHKIGQKKEILVIRLVSIGTVEENVTVTERVKLKKEDDIIRAGGLVSNRTGCIYADTIEYRRFGEVIQSKEESDNLNSIGRKFNEILARNPREFFLFESMDKNGITRSKAELYTEAEAMSFFIPGEKRLKLGNVLRLSSHSEYCVPFADWVDSVLLPTGFLVSKNGNPGLRQPVSSTHIPVNYKCIGKMLNENLPERTKKKRGRKKIAPMIFRDHFLSILHDVGDLKCEIPDEFGYLRTYQVSEHFTTIGIEIAKPGGIDDTGGYFSLESIEHGVFRGEIRTKTQLSIAIREMCKNARRREGERSYISVLAKLIEKELPEIRNKHMGEPKKRRVRIREEEEEFTLDDE